MQLFDRCSKTIHAQAPREVVVLEITLSSDAIAKLIAPSLKEHYVTAKILSAWGHGRLVAFLAKKLPLTKRGRSGDIGEILATEYVNGGNLPYQIPINRLRWKDSREQSMRGEDLVGFSFQSELIGFLKGEAKSRRSLAKDAVAAARQALEKNDGLPFAHTLAFIAERLYEANQDDFASKIAHYVEEEYPPAPTQVAHFIFTFSGNNPGELLLADAQLAKEPIKYFAAGLHVKEHEQVISAIFEETIGGRKS